jgi:hypothetical protein
MKDIGDRIISHAAAFSIEAASKELYERSKVKRELKVKFINDNLVELGGPGLCFKENKLLKAVESGFAFPQILSLIFNFINGIESILILLEIRKILSSDTVNSEKVSLGLRSGLTGATTFANYDIRYKKLLDEHKDEVVLFSIDKTKISIWLYFSSENTWKVQSGTFSREPTTTFTFKDLSVANNAISGRFDHLGGPAVGDAKVSGNLPFLDKIGYISRKVEQQVPSIL